MQTLVSLGLSLSMGIASVLVLPAAASAQAADTKKPGVYANTDAGMATLSAFYSGVSTTLPVGFQAHTVAVPKAKTLNSLIVNMPGVDASRIVLYYLNGLTEVWAGTLTVTSAEWTGRAPGFAILEIKAGPDGIRKFYAVNLGKAVQVPGGKPTE